MNQKLILIPLLAQVLLTAIVSFRLVYARVSEMRSKRIHPQKIATTAGVNQHLVDSRKISDNFSNQFETPVLFYVLIILLYVTDSVTPVFIIMTSLFVVLRYLHSFIHCGYNNVMHRFYAFVAASLLLWATWLLLGVKLTQEAF